MAQTYSFPGPSGLASTTDGRKDIAGLITKDVNGVVRSGVFLRHLNPLVTARADMKVDVAAFEACAVQFGGPILLANDGTLQVALATAPVANSRIDVVYVKQNESAAPGTDADTSRVLAAVTGTAAASPTKPALPAGALELATVLVPAGVVATNASGVTISPTFQYSAPAGVPVPFRSLSDLQLWTTPAYWQQAFVFNDAANNGTYTFLNGSWVKYFNQTNIRPTSVVPAGAGSSASVDANGVVNFTNCTSLIVNGVFTPDCPTTDAIFDVTQTNNVLCSARYAAGGVPIQSASYTRQVFTAAASATSVSTTANDPQMYMTGTYATFWSGWARFFLTALTRLKMAEFHVNRPDWLSIISAGTSFTTPCDGLYFAPTAGTMSGSVRFQRAAAA